MNDTDKPKLPNKVSVSAGWLAEQARKRATYSEQRRQWHRALEAHLDDPEDTAPSFKEAPETIKSRGKQPAKDPRQMRLF